MHNVTRGFRSDREMLEEERKLLSAILDTVGALVAVLETSGRIVRLNRACEQTAGHSIEELQGTYFWNLFPEEEHGAIKTMLERGQRKHSREEYEGSCVAKDGSRRVIAWSTTILAGSDGGIQYVIATGTDRTERKWLENTILEISEREQRRIAQDLHDGLGQHLTGIAFLTKVQEQKLAEKSLTEAADASKIVRLVNEAIHKARELARGLQPVLSQPHGLMSALQHWAGEVEDMFQIRCRFECEDPVLVADESVANHLYHIAQEAIHNAVKHGHAKNVVIGLSAGDDEGALTIRDDGCGIPAVLPSHAGMGLRIMNYRKDMIGGTFQVSRAGDSGTVVTCIFPMSKPERAR